MSPWVIVILFPPRRIAIPAGLRTNEEASTPIAPIAPERAVKRAEPEYSLAEASPTAVISL